MVVRRASPRRSRELLVLFFAALLTVSACSRGASLGTDEAVEILVLDGVERLQAECLVSGLEGELGLDKITGVDPEMDDADLVVLSAASAACAPTIPEDGGVAAGDEDLADLLDSEIEVEIEVRVGQLVHDLVRGGVAPEVATCMGSAVEAAAEPLLTFDDERFLADAFLGCDGS